MKKLLLVIWLVLPVAGAAYHYGPGQEQLELEEVDDLLAKADRHAAAEEWFDAEEAYDAALEKLPEDQIALNRRIRLERAKAQMLNSKLPVARQELESLVDELEEDADAEAELRGEAREALASSQYYMTWLMRLEGLPREKWEPEIEAARQNYRLLAEEAGTTGLLAMAERQTENLEASIRLARMDLGELQGLPLPGQ